MAPGVVKSTRTALVRMVVLLVLATFLPTALATEAEAGRVPRAYAGIVIDAKTGKTLYAQAADSLRYPASVTKVMTLYILFQEMEAGRMSLNSRLTVSQHAANAVPTKLGLRPGQTIRVEDAIKAIVTLSANDVARVIAENIGGTESQFAQRMTRTARELGMKRTNYANASGLPDSRQTTTVRDQARLGVAIYEHFPKYYKYFQTRVFTYKGRRYGNHNRLLGAVPGVDGIKTGYIRAAGFNLLTAARKDNRHLVVAAFGFDSSSSRNAKVTSLVRKYLPRARSGSYLRIAEIPKPGAAATRLAAVTPAPRPDFRVVGSPPVTPVPLSQAPVQIASAALPASAPPVPQQRPVDLMAPAAASSPAAQTGVQAVSLVASAEPVRASAAPQASGRTIDVIGAWISQTLKLDQDSGALVPPAPIDRANAPAIDLLTSGSVNKGAGAGTQAETQAPAADPAGWIVQIGATPNAQGANVLLSTATTRIADLGDYRQYVEKIERNGQTFYRARIAGFGDRDRASAMCSKLKANKMSCLAVKG